MVFVMTLIKSEWIQKTKKAILEWKVYLTF